MISKTQRGVAATQTVVFAAALAGLSFFCATRQAEAFPKFARAEKKACVYCHVNPAGSGKRNAAGIWYDKHNFSFADYTPEKAAALYGGGAAPTPTAAPTITPSPAPTAKPTPKPTAKPKPKAAAKKPVKKPVKAAAKK